MDYQTFDDVFVNTYKRTPPPMIKGEGIYLFDSEGKKYLDFGAGIAVNALGHCHPDIVAALKKQAEILIHSSNLYYNLPQYELAKLLSQKTFGGKVFFCNSGTEAIEAAIKFARKFAFIHNKTKEKYHVLSFSNCFHGRTYGALSATAQEQFKEGFGPFLEGFHFAKFNDISQTKNMLNKYNFCAIIVEPIQGEGGINIGSLDFLSFLREYTKKNQIILIFDEIQCGLGRCGSMWCCEQYNIIPDIIACAKPLGGGLPLGAVICKEHVAEVISAGNHGTTFGGNPVACALGKVIVEKVSDSKFLENVKNNGEFLLNCLNQIYQKHHNKIKEIRGKGLMIGVELNFDPTDIISKCRENGLLVIKAENKTIRFMPPLIVNKEQITNAVDIFDNVLLNI
jgi:predicted acetylornithine/succinylornithine family transaminase